MTKSAPDQFKNLIESSFSKWKDIQTKSEDTLKA